MHLRLPSNDLTVIEKWGKDTLVSFNHSRVIQAAISLKRNQGLPPTPLQLLSRNLVFIFRLVSLGKLTSIPLLNMHVKSLVSSPEPAGFFSSSHLLTIYKSRIRPSLEYCSHVWGGAPKSTLNSSSTKSSPKPSHQQSKPHQVAPTSFPSSFSWRSFHLLQIVSRILLSGHQRFIPVPLKGSRTTRSSAH